MPDPEALSQREASIEKQILAGKRDTVPAQRFQMKQENLVTVIEGRV